MVTAGEVLADFGERMRGELADQVHGQLSGLHQFLAAALAAQVTDVDTEGARGRPDYFFHRQLNFAGGENVRQGAGGTGNRHRTAAHARVDDDPDQGSFKFTDVGGDLAGDVFSHIGRQVEIPELGVLFEDRHPRLKFRRLDVRDQAPFEAAAQPVFQRGNVFRGPVARQDYLFAGLVQRVERMEEFFLGLFLAGDELHVVNEQQVDGTVAFPERVRVLFPDRVDEVVGEGLSRDVFDRQLREQAGDLVPDRVHQVGFAEAGFAVQEQGIVRVAGLLRDRLGSGVRKVVVAADHETFEPVLAAEPRRRRQIGRAHV